MQIGVLLASFLTFTKANILWPRDEIELGNRMDLDLDASILSECQSRIARIVSE